MLKSPSGIIAGSIMISLAACYLANPNQLSAQSDFPALVVVAEESTADCVNRIGREHVRVELLFIQATGLPPDSYEVCDQRAQSLLKFEMLVVRADNESLSEGFWQDRMAAANPRGKVHLLLPSRSSAADTCGSRMEQLVEVHRALVSILPEHRETLDSNLKTEMRRLHSLRYSPLQVASRD